MVAFDPVRAPSSANHLLMHQGFECGHLVFQHRHLRLPHSRLALQRFQLSLVPNHFLCECGNLFPFVRIVAFHSIHFVMQLLNIDMRFFEFFEHALTAGADVNEALALGVDFPALTAGKWWCSHMYAA